MNFFTRTLRLCAAALALAACTQPALAWWNEDWTVRTRVTLDTTAAGLPLQAPVNGAPLALRLHSGNFDFVAAKDDGADLRVLAGDDKMPLRFRIEKYDPANELALIWVQLPALAAGSADNRVFVYAGNAKAAAEPPWTGGGAGELASFPLAARNGADLSGALAAQAPVTLERNALLGAGARLAGEAVVWPAGAATQVAAGGPLTWSLWARPEAAAGVLLQQGPLTLGWRAGKLEARVGNRSITAGELPTGAWGHVALVFDQGQATLYVNGVPGSPGSLPLPALAGPLSAGVGFDGVIDQIEIASVARSADWLKLAVDTQGIATRLVKSQKQDPASAAAAEGGGGGQTGYMRILVDNLTLDAWIVIAILAVMFVIAAWVMVSKTLLVTRTDRANRNFLVRFREAKDDLLTVAGDSDPALKASTLQRLYLSGVRELNKRDEAIKGSGLSGASIDAIKAAVDADMVRESHHLNARIVLLTIAISGGPFLGLLGTVVGVMIVFAAIAAAGDVNVNAIAPGVAAALLATVAGLAVAIPALFGYNWLAARIKNITSDMQIFADEFIARVAELYGKP